MEQLIVRFVISALAVAGFLLIVMPFFYEVLLCICFPLLGIAESINEKMKNAEGFLGALSWMIVLIVCSIGLIITTSLLNIFKKIDLFDIIEEQEEDSKA